MAYSWGEHFYPFNTFHYRLRLWKPEQCISEKITYQQFETKVQVLT